MPAESSPAERSLAEGMPDQGGNVSPSIGDANHNGTNLTSTTGTSAQRKTTAGTGKHKPKGSDKDWLTEFELTERSGKLISSQSFLGQPYVIGFFYATCPSICVRQNEKFKVLQEKFRGQPIRLVEITCDPEVDRPEVLAEYANRFDADPEQWLFFTGDMDYISRVGSEMYSIGVMRRGHPEKFALVDAKGKIFGYYTWSDAAQWQTLQQDMAKLIAEQVK
ncbi:MAG: SCO family protein [Pirellulaceae bacterium]|nr:SCO family protein [Pirellulaceae bacterium]